MDSLQKLCENRKVIIETVCSPSMPAGYAIMTKTVINWRAI
jgi:hypothetical protein